MKNCVDEKKLKREFILIPRPKDTEKELRVIFGDVLKEFKKEKLFNPDIIADLRYLIEDYFNSLDRFDESCGLYTEEFSDDVLNEVE